MFQLKIPVFSHSKHSWKCPDASSKKIQMCHYKNTTADGLTSSERSSSFRPTDKSSRALLTKKISCGVTFTNVETQIRTAVTCLAACNSSTIPSTSLCGGRLARSVRISLRYVTRTSLDVTAVCTNVTANIISWQLGWCQYIQNFSLKTFIFDDHWSSQ